MQHSQALKRQLSAKRLRARRDGTASSARISEALRLRAKVIDAVTWKSTQRLRTLLRQLIAFQPSRAEMIATGIGLLLGDRSIWTLVGQVDAALANVALRRWKSKA